jgi:hypothetical protein
MGIPVARAKSASGGKRKGRSQSSGGFNAILNKSMAKGGLTDKGKHIAGRGSKLKSQIKKSRKAKIKR